MYGNKKNEQNTIVVKKEIEQPKNLDFVDYAKKMEGNFEDNPNYLKNHFSQQKGIFVKIVMAYENIDEINVDL